MQGWHYGKGLIYFRPIFRLTKLAFFRARVIPGIARLARNERSKGQFLSTAKNRGWGVRFNEPGSPERIFLKDSGVAEPHASAVLPLFSALQP